MFWKCCTPGWALSLVADQQIGQSLETTTAKKSITSTAFGVEFFHELEGKGTKKAANCEPEMNSKA